MPLLDEKKVATSITPITIPPPVAGGPDKHPVQSITALDPVDDVESPYPLSQTPTAVSPDGKTGLNPFSPFYDHTPSRLSLEATKSEGRRSIIAAAPAPINTTTSATTAAYDTDVEACTPPTSACSLDKPAKTSADRNFHCSVWPSREAMKLKKKAMRREKARYMLCGWMAGFSKPVRIWIKVAMAVVLVGAAVGVAIGISKAVGGGVWKNSDNTHAPIGHPQNSRR